MAATNATNKDIEDAKQEDTFVKKKLMYHLQTRPERQQLVNLNILKAFDQDPSLRAVMDNLMKQRLRMLLSSRILDKKLSNRKSIQSLIREGILKGDNEEDDEKGDERRDMYRRMSNHSLTEFLSQRPTLQELVKANMVQDVMTWTKITCSGTIPHKRNCHQMCLNRDDTSLYLLGGFNTGSVSIDLLKFDIENQKWSRPLVGGPVPPERYCHSVVNIDSNLVVFGGFSVEGKWLNDLHALDTEYAMNSEFKAFVPRLSAYGQCKASTNNSQMLLWYPPETTGDPPSPRAAHAACVIGKKMYIFGGNNYNKLFNDLHCLDTSNMKWSQIITQGVSPSPRANHTLTAIGDKYLIVFGGNDGQPLNDVHIFDIEKNLWSQPKINGTPPLARGGHSAVCIKNKQLLIFAGGYNNKILNDLYILDVETMTWIRPSDTGMLPEPRAGHSCCVTKNNVVYICGGGDSENDKLFNDLYQLDTGYFTTDEKQISKLIYTQKNIQKHEQKHNHQQKHEQKHEQKPKEEQKQEPISLNNYPPQWTMSRCSYEYNNGNFSQSNFQNHIQNFINTNSNEQYSMDAPLMQAGVISDDISNISQEIDSIIQSVENGIKGKINEFRQKEQGYIMILRSIEAERSKLIDDVNRDITMLKFSVKESLDNLQQKFIAKTLRQHIDYVNNQNNSYQQQYQSEKVHHHSKTKSKSKSKTKPKTTLVRSPLTKPSLGVIQEEENHNKDESKHQNDNDKIDNKNKNKNKNNHNHNENTDKKENMAPMTINDETKEQIQSTKENKNVRNNTNENMNNKDNNTSNNNNDNDNDKSTPGADIISNDNNNHNNGNNNGSSQSPHPANSQSPNPTLTALQQQQMGLIPKSNNNTMINAALTQQAQYQNHQMMARHFVKVQEMKRQQKIQQMAQQASQHFAVQNNNNNNNNGNNNMNNNWWQRGPNMYGVSHYSFNSQQQQNGQHNQQNGQQPKKPKKKRRKKKKRNKNNQQQQLLQQQQQQQQAQTQAQAQAQPQLEGNINNMAIPNLLNNNVFMNNPISSPINNAINIHHNLNNGLSNNGIHHHAQFQQYNPNTIQPLNPLNGQSLNGQSLNGQSLSPPNLNPTSTLNPNAMTFKQ